MYIHAKRKGKENMFYEVSKEVFDKLPNFVVGVVAVTGINNAKEYPAIRKMLEDNSNEVIQYFAESGNKAKTRDYKVSASRVCKDEIDLRGMMGEEAWFKVDKYLDEAMLTGLHTVRLIHGKGTGALKKALWEHLRRDSRIKSFRIGQYGEGDGGVTVVELK